MTQAIEIFGPDAIERLPCVARSDEDVALRYTRALVRDGAGSYVDNADVRTGALVVDGKVLPLVLAKMGGVNSHVCSPRSHYVRYLAAERAMRHRRVPRFLFRAAALPSSLGLRLGGIDDVVYVNNWLFSTNPQPGLSSDQIGRLTAKLTATYPRSAIVLRSVNPHVDRSGFDALQHHGFRLVRSRRVYVLDTAGGRHLAHSNVRRDLDLLRHTPYEIVGSPQDLETHIGRLTALYRDLYLCKYPDLNPQFNARFFALTLRDEVLTYRALRRGGRIDAFAAYFVRDGTLTATVIGYDRQLPRRLGLYRMAFAVLIAEAAAHALRLNMSAGAGRHKVLRGGRPADEFDAIFDRHLPWPRRLAWTALMVASNRYRL
jgi:hypothetical protein